MSDQSRSTLVILRWAWCVLLALLLLLVWIPAGVAWRALTGLLWLAGSWLLMRPERSEALARNWQQAFCALAPRVGLVVLSGLMLLVAQVFSILAAVVLAVVFGLIAIVLADTGASRVISEGVTGLAMLGVTLVLALGAGELLFRSPSLARRYGAPAEIHAWSGRYDGLWKHNVFGIRSPYERTAKPPGVYRIVVLGDSYTWGDKIAQTDSTWPARLERTLRTARGDTAIEVINMGERGFTTANEAEELRRIGWQFDPDLVVVQFLANDALPSRRDFGHEDVDWLVPSHALLPSRFTTGTVANSALFAFMERQYNTLRAGGHQDYEALPSTVEPGFIGWQQLRDGLREMADSAHARRVPIVLAIFPLFIPGHWTATTYPVRALQDKVAREATRDGFRVFDLTPVFEAQGGDWRRWWATPYDGHPGPAADAIAADAVYGYLVQNQLMRFGAPSDQRAGRSTP